jgi:hypothetical protein
MTAIKNTCSFCNYNVSDELLTVYSVVVITDKNVYRVGVPRMLEDLENFLRDKYYHLTASQILLLRPDVVKSFMVAQFKEKGEVVTGWTFSADLVCGKCFKIWERNVPLR